MFGIEIDIKRRMEALEKEFNELKGLYDNYKIPYEMPWIMKNDFFSAEFRNKIIKEQGYVFLSHNWLSELAIWIGKRKCLEVMSGGGALAYNLRKYGVDIISTDNYQFRKMKEEGNLSWDFKIWEQAENLDCVNAIDKYGEQVDIVIMAWAYMDINAYRTLIKMREVNPNCLMIFIGEGYGGCTANDDFFEEINIIDDEEFNKINEHFESWNFINDRLVLLK